MEEEKEKVTHNFYIAGVKFHQARSVLSEMAEGDVLILEPEPTNPYDPNAVRIIFDNGDKRAMLGFVPKKFSSEVSAALEVGKSLICELVQLNVAATTWEQLKVEIKEFS